MNKLEGNIIWLASYPKSGNTWTRLFLQALKEGKPLKSLNNIDATEKINSCRNTIDNYLGVDSSEMNQLSVQKYRAQIHQMWSDEMTEPTILKTHDTPFHNGIRIITKLETNKIILIVRNPFDLVASYANHMVCSIDHSVQSICNSSNRIAITKKKYATQVSQHIGSWSSYYRDWKNAFGSDVFVLRYEDLQADPVFHFSQVVKHLGWEYSESQIERAVVNSDFKILQELEKTEGFFEAPRNLKTFFRAGKSGNWKNEINQAQVDLLIDCHYNTLLELGYIDQDRNILV